MKKVIALLLAVLMLVSLMACSGKTAETPAPAETTEASDAPATTTETPAPSEDASGVMSEEDAAAARDAGSVAAESHGGRQALLPTGAAAVECLIHVEGNPRQIAEILEQRKQWEEDCHGREHDRDDPGNHPVHAVDQHADKPHRSARACHPFRELPLKPEQPIP